MISGDGESSVVARGIFGRGGLGSTAAGVADPAACPAWSEAGAASFAGGRGHRWGLMASVGQW